jgi:hypothetical protein
MRRTVIEWLRPLDAVSVENAVYPGTPDVNYVEGWLELKSVDRWPPRGGALRVEHFSPQQRVWLLRRTRVGGAADVLLKVGTDWLLLEGSFAASRLGEATREELVLGALRVWEGRQPGEELVECLRRA